VVQEILDLHPDKNTTKQINTCHPKKEIIHKSEEKWVCDSLILLDCSPRKDFYNLTKI
jgi:hypothetical protein